MAHQGTSPAAALTTVFTPIPDYCRTGLYRHYTDFCMPPAWSTYWYGNVGYYSPGICPYGYTSAGTPKLGAGPAVETTETAIVCCPSSYTYNGNSYTSGCASSVPLSYSYSTSVTYISSLSQYSAYTYTWTTSDFYVYAIQVRFAESDLSILATHPQSPGVRYTSLNNTSNSTSITSAITDGDGKSKGGLATGAKIGIGVGVGLVVLLIAAALFFVFLRRARRARNLRQAQEQAYQSPMPGTIDNRGSALTEKGLLVASSPSSASPISPNNMSPTIDNELQRIQERRSRLQELERLDAQEQQLRTFSGDYGAPQVTQPQPIPYPNVHPPYYAATPNSSELPS
jgi:hypothetical protein